MRAGTQRAIEAGHMVMVPKGTLPIQLAGGGLGCAGCRCLFQPVAYSVLVPGRGSMCRGCARADAELRPWQDLCDLTGVIDDLYRGAADQHQRDLFASMLHDVVGHFAAWRYPEAGGAE